MDCPRYFLTVSSMCHFPHHYPHRFSNPSGFVIPDVTWKSLPSCKVQFHRVEYMALSADTPQTFSQSYGLKRDVRWKIVSPQCCFHRVLYVALSAKAPHSFKPFSVNKMLVEGWFPHSGVSQVVHMALFMQAPPAVANPSVVEIHEVRWHRICPHTYVKGVEYMALSP